MTDKNDNTVDILTQERLEQLEKQLEAIAFNNSEYTHGYKYGNQGKFSKPAGQSEEWNEGYEDGRGDLLSSINNERKE